MSSLVLPAIRRDSCQKSAQRLSRTGKEQSALLGKDSTAGDLFRETAYHAGSCRREDHQGAFFETAGDTYADSGTGHGSGKLSELVDQGPDVPAYEIADLLDNGADDQSGKEPVSHAA